MTASPTGAARFTGGVWVRGRGLRDVAPTVPDPDFALHLGSARLRQRHQSALPWPHEWTRWPDFLLSVDRHAAARPIVHLHDQARSGLGVDVACGGGVSGTGTVMACPALTGLPSRQAGEGTRKHYHHCAVETPWQRRWVACFSTRAGT